MLRLIELNPWIHLDAPSPDSYYFQDLGAPIFEGLVQLHDCIAFLIIVVAGVVLWLLWSLMTTFDRRSIGISMITKHPNHSIALEWFLTVLPVLFLLMIAFPSFRLLYLMDDTMDATLTVKAVAQQWNWSYEYSDFAIGATEAAIKYLLMSGLASSLLLFGTSMRYGETGTTNLALWLELNERLGTPWLASSLWILIVTAWLIKIAASPINGKPFTFICDS